MRNKVVARLCDNLCLPLIVIAGLLTTVILFAPGYMSADSIDQLRQGRSGVYHDWHPPVMSWLWGQLDQIVPGPLGMLVFHNLLFWGGLGLLVALVAPKWNTIAKSLSILAIGFFPPIFFLLSTIWKDIGMAAALLAAAALLCYAERRRSRAALLLSLPPLWYGVAIRHNAAIAALPLTIYAGFIGFALLFPRVTLANRWRNVINVLSGVGVLLLMLMLSNGVSNLLTGHVSRFPLQQILVHDVVALSIATDTVLLPDYLKSSPEQPSVADLEKIYTSDEVRPLFCCDKTVIRLKLTDNPDNVTSLQQVWIQAVLSHPGLYFIHRFRIFESQFGLGRSSVCYPYHHGIDLNDLGIPYRDKPFTAKLFTHIIKVQDGALFRGWLYLATNAILLVATAWGKTRLIRNRSVIFFVSASGLMYGASYLMISTTCEFRMAYWTVTAALVCSLAAVTSLFPARQDMEGLTP